MPLQKFYMGIIMIFVIKPITSILDPEIGNINNYALWTFEALITVGLAIVFDLKLLFTCVYFYL